MHYYIVIVIVGLCVTEQSNGSRQGEGKWRKQYLLVFNKLINRRKEIKCVCFRLLQRLKWTKFLPSPQCKAKLEILTLYDIIGLESINNVNT